MVEYWNDGLNEEHAKFQAFKTNTDRKLLTDKQSLLILGRWTNPPRKICLELDLSFWLDLSSFIIHYSIVPTFHHANFLLPAPSINNQTVLFSESPFLYKLKFINFNCADFLKNIFKFSLESGLIF
jgi:hypothetical protein